MIDCTSRGFPDGHMVVNYIGSHDLMNDAFSDRFYNWLGSNGVTDPEPRIKLAFVCLLTAVGIPMILAGDEFAAQRKFVLTDENKQIEPLDLRDFDDPWRQDVFAYVARLVRVRTTSPALARNECSIIHTDTTDGRLIVVWQRGVAPNLVIVIANFSDFISTGGLAGEYVVPEWPALAGVDWYEVSQAAAPRLVTAPGREPLFAWEAKVYLSRPRGT
jgi:pullulanase